MGILNRLLGSGSTSNDNPNLTSVREPNPEAYAQYMLGFRLGMPVEDDPLATYPSQNTEAFQRGLEAGKAAASQQEEEASHGLF